MKTTRETIQEIVNIFQSPEVKRIAVSGHTAPDGDSIAACVAFTWLVRKATGKDVDVFVFGDFPERFRFLDPDRTIHSIYTSKQFKGDGLVKLFGQYDLAVSLDTALIRQFPNNYYEHIFLKSLKTIKIDHHPYMEAYDKDSGQMVPNDFAQCNLMDDSFNSSTQILWRMVEPFGLQYDRLDKSFLEAVYTGLITDTGTFLYAKNASAFQDAAAILEQGIDHIETRRKTFGDMPLCVYRIRQNVQRNVRLSDDGRIAWLTEDDELKSLKAEAKGIGCKDEAVEETIITLCELLQVQGVEIVLKVNNTNFSVKSKQVDISKLAMKYGGGGHVNASAFSVTRDDRTNEEILDKIVSEYQEVIDNEKRRCRENRFDQQ